MPDAIPVLGRFDVLIVGGTSGAVACALEAAAGRARVFLAAPRPYLGEDIAAHFDYWPAADDEFACDLARQVFPQGPDPAATPPTPMHVKRTLEQALVRAGVNLLLNTHPAGVLRDERGRIRGAVVAGRTGRAAIVAGHVIDATERGLLARQAGAEFTPWPGGKQAVRFVTLGGQPVQDDGLAVEPLPPMVATVDEEPTPLEARRYTAEVGTGDGGWRALAAAHAGMIDRCWTPGTFQHSEQLTLRWPDRLAGEARGTRWEGCDTFPLDALSVEPGLEVLGAVACVERAVAERLCRPAHLMAVGGWLGQWLAEQRESRSGATAPGSGLPSGGASASASRETLHPGAGRQAASGTRVPFHATCAGSEIIDTGEVRTLLRGPRPLGAPDETCPAPHNAVPRIGRYDVVVVGGGTGGAPAAIAAARAGARTLVLENMPMLGGVGTAGQISRYWFGNPVGFTAEVDQGVTELETDDKLKATAAAWSPSAKQAWYRCQAVSAGADVWFGTICCGVWRVGDRVRGVVICGPHGYGLVEAGAVVDATGNAEVAAAAGAEVTGIGAEHVAIQGTGLAGVLPGKPYHNTDHNFSDDTDAVDATAFLVSSKEKFKHMFDAGQLVDSRERQQIVGDVTLGPADILGQRRFADTICIASSNFDTHGFTIHPLFLVKPPDKQRLWAHVPYRCLLPRGLDGVLVTGLGVSAHRDAIPVIRMQADVQNQGYAAGHAAAVAARQGVGVRSIDVKALQQHLVEIGNLPPEVLDDTETRIDDERLRWAVEEGWDDYLGLSLCFAQPERARPLLRQAYRQAPADSPQRLRYALILGLLGDAVGVATLRDEVANRPWDEGWNYRGMGQFGMSMSEVDALLVALGACDDGQTWPVVLEKVRTLPDDPALSHCRAIAEVCEQFQAYTPHPDAAEALAAVLTRPGMTGHSQPDLAAVHEQLTDNANENDVRNRALRELHLARALFRCGDHAGLGADLLRAYTQDMRGHFARHAHAVLAAAREEAVEAEEARLA